MFVVGNFGGVLADKLHHGGMSLTAVRKLMQVDRPHRRRRLPAGRPERHRRPARPLALMCGALGLLAFTWSGFVPNHLDIAPRYADVLMGITNTAGTIPGIIGVAITGWMVDTTGTYAAAFALCAAVNIFGAVVWLFFATAERVID